MPEIVTHHFFARKVLDHLPKNVTAPVYQELFFIGARGPDPLGIVRFWWLPAWRREHRKSFVMHHQHSGTFFRKLATVSKESEGQVRDELFSFLCGFLTHYFLDASCHPYIIYRTGLGEGTSGNHRSLEHALDRDVLKEHQLSLHDRPISRQILPSSVLPSSMKLALNTVYREVFGWENMWDLINAALKDEKRFIKQMEDPNGRRNRFISQISHNGTLRSLSYAEEAYRNADCWNDQHTPWQNPYDPSIVSNLSLRELETEAFQLAVKVIPQIYEFVYGQASYPEQIGNRSYESGLPTDDLRNQNVPHFDLLAR